MRKRNEFFYFDTGAWEWVGTCRACKNTLYAPKRDVLWLSLLKHSKTECLNGY